MKYQQHNTFFLPDLRLRGQRKRTMLPMPNKNKESQNDCHRRPNKTS